MNNNKVLTDEKLEKVNGGVSFNGDGTYSLINGETFETSSQGNRMVYVIQGDYPNAVLDCRLEVYFMEFSNNTMINDGIKVLSLKEIFDNCNINY